MRSRQSKIAADSLLVMLRNFLVNGKHLAIWLIADFYIGHQRGTARLDLVPKFMFPSPVDVGAAFVEDFPILMANSGTTLAEEMCIRDRSEDDMMKVRNLGRKSLEEVVYKLNSLGFSLRKDDE